MSEYKPWEDPNQKIEEALPKRKTVEVEEGMEALKGIREKMGQVLKKDQALKISMAPTTPYKKREEGDVWKERGKLWTIKNGIKQTVTKMDGAKIPWWCPECGKTMKRIDVRMWFRHSVCHDCVLREDTERRLAGSQKDYEEQKIKANMQSYLRDVIEELEGYKNMIGSPQIHFADGTWETWDVDVSQLKLDLQAEIKKLQEMQEALEEDEDTGSVEDSE